MMSLQEKALFHQIHPVKLATDIASSAVSTWLCWRRRPVAALVVGLVPSVVVSAVMLATMDFSAERDSPFGRYVARYMTRGATITRSSGQIAMWVGAWQRRPWAIALGAATIVRGWTYPFWEGRRDA
jgi:hypothetical protein